MRSFIITCLLILIGTNSAAQTRYEVAGDTLYLDMRAEALGYKLTRQLEFYDVRLLSEYLFEYPEIQKLNVTGLGGHMGAALEMARDLSGHGIDTIASGKCFSACAMVFLGGRSRTLSPVAKLGFHRQWVNSEEHKENYTLLKENMGLKDEFDYLMYIYNKLNSELIAQLTFMIDQDVSVDFIMKALATEIWDMWIPSKHELLAAGVISRLSHYSESFD